jgi:phage tail-like protein
VARQTDPFHGFRFRVEFDQVQHGGFSKVKGLSREIKVESRREGGLNDYEHKLMTQVVYSNLILERGVADEYLWAWHDETVEGLRADGPGVKRKTITVVMFDAAGDEAWRWLIEEAYPVKWTGSDLDAASSQVFVESVELAHHGIRKG